jgi:drug/metabolite transporter (DMT)-like permease
MLRVMAEPILSAPGKPGAHPHPLLGYAMVWTAATLFAVNGTVSKVVLSSGISPVELTEIRSLGAFAGFAVVLALRRPRALRVGRRELPFLVLFGVTGLAFVQWFYFVSIHRLPVGIALLIQYIAPLLVALWARYVFHEAVRRRIWLALALALGGLSLIVEVWGGQLELDGVGVAAALAAAGAFAVYVLAAERGLRSRDAISLSCYGFLFAGAFWAVVHPLWRFPAGRLDDRVSLLGNLDRFDAPVWLLVAFVVGVGSMLSFALIVSALHHVPATRVGIVAMLEPVVAALVAYLWLGEELDSIQLLGGMLVLIAIVLAQTAR